MSWADVVENDGIGEDNSNNLSFGSGDNDLSYTYEQPVLDRLESELLDTQDEDVGKKNHCCYHLPGEVSLLSAGLLCSHILSWKDYLHSSCLASVVQNSCKGILPFKGDLAGRHAVIDLFLRSRHDLLHNLSMLSLGLDVRETDEPFKHYFPWIDSNKTPDRILVKEQRVLILESTATLNTLKSYISKGKLEQGFKSKYEVEISKLEERGYDVDYVVLSFDVKEPTNCSYKKDLLNCGLWLDVTLNENIYNILDLIRCVFCNYSSKITKRYSTELMNVLSQQIHLPKPDLKEVDYLIKVGEYDRSSYSRLTISTNMYTRVGNSWPRFIGMLDKIHKNDKQKFLPYYDHATSKFSIRVDGKGISYVYFLDVLISENKPGFCKLLRQVYENRPFEGDRPEIEFFTVKKFDVTVEEEAVDQIHHLNSGEWNGSCELSEYDKYIVITQYVNKKHKYEDPDYEEKMVDSIVDFIRKVDTDEKFETFSQTLKKKPFSFYKLTEKTLSNAVVEFKNKMQQLNSEQVGTIIKYQKPPFLNHLASLREDDYSNYKSSPEIIIDVLRGRNIGPFTNEIIKVITNPGFPWGSKNRTTTPEYEKLQQKQRELNKEMYEMQRLHVIETGVKKMPKIKDVKGGDAMRKKQSELQKDMRRCMPEGKPRSIVKLPSVGAKSQFKQQFAEEMSHYKSKRESSSFKGVGNLTLETLFNEFIHLKAELKSPCGNCPDEFYHDFVANDSSLLMQLKNDYLLDYSDNKNFLKSTGLYHSAAFVSRLCHSLNFYSQTPTGGNYIHVDNLGYNNVILLVKGGKKSFQTKKSKLYRLFYPVHISIKNWYDSGNYSTSCKLFEKDNRLYLATPWSMMDEVVMNDGITFLHKVAGYIMLSHEKNLSKAFDKCFFNVMLAFHARRKTEELLHNLRYVCVNCISNISRVDLMLPELAGFNYDFFQAFIRSSLEKNFYQFGSTLLRFNNEKKAGNDYMKINKMKNLFDKADIETLEDLTMTIYSTFLMSKSPTNQVLEQVKNLKNMLATKGLHEQQSSPNPEKQYEINGIKNEGDLANYWDELFTSDFNYDPTFCVQMGRFTKSYLANLIEPSDLSQKWHSLLNHNWDEFANTKGLRGMSDTDFFGNKGYFIVYKEVMKDATYLETVKGLLISSWDDHTKRKKLLEMNKRYIDQVGCKNLEGVVFSVVDKKQRGGSREIFVMDLQTKLNQQMIEKFMCYICSKIPNEAISIPSNKRLQHIHTNVFEKRMDKDADSYNLTLDCRKWAPHSVINKFVDMVLALNDYLPETFVTHCLIFFSKLYNKKVYTREKIFEVLSKSKATEELSKYLIADAGKKGYYMNMSYSWMMGIFNYMSSFLHVMNQLYISHILMTANLKAKDETCFYHMNAHSDDSGGKVQVKDFISMRQSFFVYELLLKSCNHMLSDKKCNISKRFFEFLSVLYINNTLLSLIAKISGQFNFHPSDSGYTGDINECYSKCIEMVSSGATFQQAYLSLKISSHAIYRFYNNSNPTANCYILPPQILGLPDAHPVMVLISGSDSDIIRLTYKDPEVFKEHAMLSTMLSVGKDLSLDYINPITVSPNIMVPKKFLNLKDMFSLRDLPTNLTWAVKNLPSSNTALGLLKYGLLLEDKKFLASMIDENPTRRVSRAYHYRYAKVVNTINGYHTYKTVRNALIFTLSGKGHDLNEEGESLISSIESEKSKLRSQVDIQYSLYELMNREVYSFAQSLDKISYSISDMVDFKKTCKPMHFNMQKTNLPTSSKFDPASLSIWIKHPELRWMIHFGDDYENRYQQFKGFLSLHDIEIEMCDTNWIYILLTKLKQKYVKEYYIYSNVPSEIRDISSYKDLLTLVAHNSFKGKYIQGISIPMGIRVANPLTSLFSGVLSKELMRDLMFTNFVFTIIHNDELFKEICKLKLNPVSGLVAKGVYDYCELIKKRWDVIPESSCYISPHLSLAMQKMGGALMEGNLLLNSHYYCFTKNQKLIGNTWLGRGKMVINCPNSQIELSLNSNRIESITCNRKAHVFTLQDTAFINNTLLNAGLPKIDECMGIADVEDWDKVTLGISHGGLLCIEKSRNLLISYKNFNYVPVITSPAASPGLHNLKINRDFSYKLHCRDELYGDKVYTLNTFKISPYEMLDMLVDLFDNEENKKFLESAGEEFKPYLKMFVGNVVGADLVIDKFQLTDHFTLTKTYKMMKTLVLSEKITSQSLQPRKHIYPGQEGGLVDALIKYKELNPDFSFDPNVVLSPEMMSLKSSQPESFLTNLLTNLKEKYAALYSSDDKAAINTELTRLLSFVDNSEFEKSLMKMLTTWGYIGVQATLENLTNVKKAENFRSFRNIKNNPVVFNFNQNCLKKFLDSVMRAALKYNYFSDQTYQHKKFFCKTPDDIKMCVISMVHAIQLNKRVKSAGFGAKTLSLDFLKFINTLDHLMSVEGFDDELQELIGGEHVLSTLPVNRKHINDVVVLLETLLSNMIEVQSNDVSLDFWKVRQHGIGFIQPYTDTKEFLSNTLAAHTLKFAPFHGFLSRDDVNLLKQHKVVYHANKYFDINTRQGVCSEFGLPINKNFFIKGVMKEEIDEDSDAFDEIGMEMNGDDPDPSCFEEYIEEVLEQSAVNTTRVRHRGYLVKAKQIMASIYVNPGLKSSTNVIPNIMYANDCTVLITNNYIVDLIESDSPNIKVFHKRNQYWMNNTLSDPECVFYYIIEQNPTESEVWEKFFQVEEVDRAELSEIIGSYNFNTFVLPNGELMRIDKYKTLSEKLKDLKDSTAMEVKTKEEDVVKESIDIKTIDDELKNSGFDQDYIDTVKPMLKKDKRKGSSSMPQTGTEEVIVDDSEATEDAMSKMILMYLKGKRLADISKGKTKDKISFLLNNLEDVNQATKIFEVASVFSLDENAGKSEKKNTSLKDQYMRAEFNCIAPKLIDKALSGTLAISKSKKKFLIKSQKSLRRWAMGEKNKEFKLFLLDLSMLLLNDAYNDDENNSDESFDLMIEFLTDRIIDDDSDDEKDELLSTYSKNTTGGKIYYGW